MFNFNVLKFFYINTRSDKVFHLLFVRWEFPLLGWVKINIDGVVTGSPCLAACGDIFRGSIKEFIGGFFVFLDIRTILVCWVLWSYTCIEEAKKMGLTSLWLECASILVCVAFTGMTNFS